MTDGTTTSVAGESPEITAPVRLEGQSNSEILFNWLAVNRCLWMLTTPYDEHLERIVGPRARLHLGFRLIKWRRASNHGEGHPALVYPKTVESRRAAYARLKRLIEIHLLE